MKLNEEKPLTLCLLGLGGGGFQTETESIVELINRTDIELVLIFSGPKGGILRWSTDHFIKASYAVPSPALIGEKKWKTFFLLPLNFLFALKILVKEDVNLLIGVGTIQFIPFSFACRFLGVKAWFYESITRVETPSQTGKYVAKVRLAHRAFSYWPKIKAHFSALNGDK